MSQPVTNHQQQQNALALGASIAHSLRLGVWHAHCVRDPHGVDNTVTLRDRLKFLLSLSVSLSFGV
jgi:hypothetical protein